jgi:hypothetical protein
MADCGPSYSGMGHKLNVSIENGLDGRSRPVPVIHANSLNGSYAKQDVYKCNAAGFSVVFMHSKE